MNEECPFTEEQLEWLKNNISLSVEKIHDWYNESYTLDIELKLSGEVISRGSVYL